MSNILKHQCPSCGGNLSIDNDKQIYHCSFCGSTYDYEYFREEQMHELGETYLSRKEFMAAVDAYRFVLKKDPHDFIALRGLLLASAHLTAMDELITDDSSKSFTYNSKLVSEVISGASEKNVDYFEEAGNVFSDLKKLSDLRNEIRSLGETRRKNEAEIRLKSDACNDYNFKDKDGMEHSPQTVFYTLFVIIGVALLVTIVGAVNLAVTGQGRTAATVVILSLIANLIVAAVNYKFVYARVKAIRAIESEISILMAESDKSGKKISALNDEVDTLAPRVNQAVYEFVKKDTLIMSGRA